MQIDFHHTAIYVLCRLAGMKSVHAEKVAYASQHVDDAVYDHALKFTDGSIFHQTRTAHHKLALIRIVDVNDAFNVWLPFHFLPAGEGKNNGEKLITRAVSESLEYLKKQVIASGGEDYGLHWLGIFLHLYADAFSHQDFKGFYDEYNRVDLVEAVDKVPWKDRFLNWLSRIFAPALAPIGHGCVAKNPDIPYAVWSYRRAGQEIRVDNLQERYIPALEAIFLFLLEFLEKNNQYGQARSGEMLERNMEKMIGLLKVEGSSNLRHRLWLEKIQQNYFGFPDFDAVDLNLEYHNRSWFRAAVQTEKVRGIIKRIENIAYNFYYFRKREGFANSDWVLFMRAAATHKYRVLHEVLPQCGLDIG